MGDNGIFDYLHVAISEAKRVVECLQAFEEPLRQVLQTPLEETPSSRELARTMLEARAHHDEVQRAMVGFATLLLLGLLPRRGQESSKDAFTAAIGDWNEESE